MSEQFPWLCSTVSNIKTSCGGNNAVSENESNNAEAQATAAYGTYGLQFVYYKISEDLTRDPLFGEDQLQFVERAFNIIGYCDTIPPNVRTYQLQGIWGEDMLQVFVGRSAFKYWSTYGGNDRNTPEQYDDIIPRIGDIVYLQPNDTFYEIRNVLFYNEPFGLNSHTYTITLKVYKDTKMTIDFHNPTLTDRNDPIYQYEFENGICADTNDVLAINEELSTFALYNSENNNMMDVMYHDKTDKALIRTINELPEQIKTLDEYTFNSLSAAKKKVDDFTAVTMSAKTDITNELKDCYTTENIRLEEIVSGINNISGNISALSAELCNFQYVSAMDDSYGNTRRNNQIIRKTSKRR